jgi:hypothetical protein
MIWLLVIMGTESGQPLVVKIGFNRVNAPDQDIEPQVKFLLVKD